MKWDKDEVYPEFRVAATSGGIRYEIERVGPGEYLAWRVGPVGFGVECLTPADDLFGHWATRAEAKAACEADLVEITSRKGRLSTN